VITRPFGGAATRVPVIGQGTWKMGEDRGQARAEVAALRLGIDLGLTHLDTAEMYGEGGAERVVGEAIAGQRERVFVASKVLPSNASYRGTVRACEASLRRLRTEYVDLYLLHWWSGEHPIGDTMRAMEELQARGLTRQIGVSNFDVRQLEAAAAALTRERLACNQVLYHLGARGTEKAVLPYCEQAGIAVAKKHGRTPRQVALNFLTRRPALFTIPKASRPEHVRENAAALDFTLDPADLAAIEAAFPA
jgi:diketogulonate reductase-like aldo/keto reductase